ncbi:hypothetical protein [Flavobacterium sp. LAR06]|uniref:hypothetical protein n=1 Tax=Flavobacterium sp. LAR06 TaxID=3064897 RepID=UPI0035C19051
MEKEQLSTSRKSRIKIESTVLVAIIALAGTFLGYVFDSYNNRQQQQREFESTLIINAVETGNSDISKNNLKFLIDANLISDKAQQIRLTEIITDSTYRISRGVSSSWPAGDSVYICMDSAALKFHFAKNCRGLSSCSSKIIQISTIEAKSKYNRKLCEWEN